MSLPQLFGRPWHGGLCTQDHSYGQDSVSCPGWSLCCKVICLHSVPLGTLWSGQGRIVAYQVCHFCFSGSPVAKPELVAQIEQGRPLPGKCLGEAEPREPPDGTGNTGQRG